MATLLPCIYLLAGNTSYYVTTNNDTVWGTGIWPKPGFDGQTSIMFVDGDSNLRELKPDTVLFVIIEKPGFHEVFKSTKTDMWGRLFLHQIIIGDVAVLWGFDFIATPLKPLASWYSTTYSDKGYATTTETQVYVAQKLMENPFPNYNNILSSPTDFIYYLQKNEEKVSRLYDINFKKLISKYFAGNSDVLELLQSGKLKYSNMGTFLGSYYYAVEDKRKY
jgi:hypothetical protein